MKLPKLKLGRIQESISIFVWLLIFAIPILFGETQDGLNWDHIFRIWIEYGVVFLVFLLNRFVLLPLLFFKGKRRLYLVSIIATVILVIGGVYLTKDNGERGGHRHQMPPMHDEFSNQPSTMNQQDRSEWFDNRPIPPNMNPRDGANLLDSSRIQPPVNQYGEIEELNVRPPGMGQQEFKDPPVEIVPPYASLLIFTILFIGFDTGLVLSIKWIKSEQSKMELQKENMESKMAFLQNQISPHFFMNTLNNIHALVDIDTEDAKESIIKLSRMMSYMLYESQTDKVPIKREMEFISSYIELMKIRFTEHVDVKLDIPDYLPSISIPPLLTISFIENAFKHGISYSEPCFVHVRFTMNEKSLYFEIKNKIYNRESGGANSGVGISNSINRLKLIYGDAYQLDIDSNDLNLFTVKLNIPI